MKKCLIFLCLCLAVLAVGCPAAGAADDGSILIPYAETPPVIDGIASEGEYRGEPVVMDRQSSEAWVGQVSEKISTTWLFAWDDTGFYIFATVRDKTPSYGGTNTHWVGFDCIEIGLNPGYILNRPDDKGVFFSMGAAADGTVVVYRHNYDEKIVTDQVTARATGHVSGSDSYTVEICIPWSLILIEADCTKTDTHLNATGVVPEDELIMDMVLAAIDSDEGGNITAAYRMARTDFITGKYLPANLTGGVSSETVDTLPETVETHGADTEPTTDLIIVSPSETLPDTEGNGDVTAEGEMPETQTSASPAQTHESAAQSGCGGLMALSGALLPLLAVGYWVLRKNRAY